MDEKIRNAFFLSHIDEPEKVFDVAVDAAVGNEPEEVKGMVAFGVIHRRVQSFVGFETSVFDSF